MMWCDNRRIHAGKSLCNVGEEYKARNFSVFNSQFVSYLRRSVADSLPRSCTFCRAPFPVGCVVDSVALASVYFRIFQPSPVFTITPM